VRRSLSLALLALVACESRYGAYLELESDVELDSVELYFGTPIDSSAPNTFASPKTGAQSGLVFGRQFSMFDRYDVAPTHTTTSYVPPDDANRDLGAYVVVVASRGQQAIGIAEYFGFEVPSDELHEYRLTLEPYDGGVERWGRDPGCIAWKRDRGDPAKQVVAVVEADNRDCDESVVADDCNDLCSVGCCTCDVATTLCTAPCAIGCTTSGSCAPTMCLPTGTCGATCLPLSTMEARYRCAIENTSAALTIQVDTYGDQMCSHQYQFDLAPEGNSPVPCVDPKIEYSQFATGFTYAIAADPTRPGGCVIMSMQSSGVPFTATDRMIVSVAAGGGLPRKSVIIAITPGNTPCMMMGYRVIAGGTTYGC